MLVCEDNDINQEVIREHLERLGLSVTVAPDGAKGVEEVRARREQGGQFDLILMDIHMPVMGGVDATAQIRLDGCRTPIVALTANVMMSDLDNYLQMGMVDCLGKPFRAAELWACLRRHLHEAPAPSADAQSAAAPPPADADADLGVDFKEGLENAAGNEALYRRLLGNFFSDNQTRVEELNAMVAAGETAAAHRLAHTLKSTSKMIGADRLSDAARQIEDKLKDGAGGPPLSPDDLERLGDELDAVMSRLQDMVGGIVDLDDMRKTVEQGNAGGGDPERAGALLDRLEPMLASGDSECVKLLESVRAELSGFGDRGRELAARIEEYDFEAALAVLAEMRQGLAQN